jgi:2-polyprenyl-3-methyl-5-hydroxy-6-metoxy-1,4-benzoquinol methylase
VISINVLDHCYAFDEIVRNVRAYLRPDGSAFLSFDSHEYVNVGHPLVLTEEKCRDRSHGTAFM